MRRGVKGLDQSVRRSLLSGASTLSDIGRTQWISNVVTPFLLTLV